MPDPRASTVAERIEKVAARAAGKHQRDHAVAQALKTRSVSRHLLAGEGSS
jgi:hypothetical protein